MRIYCYVCKQSKLEKEFDQQERIGDGKGHICWDCQDKNQIKKHYETSKRIPRIHGKTSSEK